jgi:hypothetical protein
LIESVNDENDGLVWVTMVGFQCPFVAGSPISNFLGT